MNKMKKMKYALPLIPFLVIVLMFELAPLISVLFNSFKLEGGSSFTLNNYIRVFTKPAYKVAIYNTPE